MKITLEYYSTWFNKAKTIPSQTFNKYLNSTWFPPPYTIIYMYFEINI